MTFKTSASAIALLAGAMLAAPATSNAAFVDFWGGGATGTVLDGPTTFAAPGGGTIIATAGGGAGTLNLIQVDQGASGAERGLGVCFNGESCNTGANAGQSAPYTLASWNDDAELDNLRPNNSTTSEVIRLRFYGGATPDGTFRFGSLDTQEAGFVQWLDGANQNHVVGYASDAANSTVVTIAGASISRDAAGLVTLSLSNLFNGTGTCTGTAAETTGCTFQFNFSAGGSPGITSDGNGNDYLVASAGVGGVVPLPAALPMFLAALAGLGLVGRRKG